jgi:hypothetical protein
MTYREGSTVRLVAGCNESEWQVTGATFEAYDDVMNALEPFMR